MPSMSASTDENHKPLTSIHGNHKPLHHNKFVSISMPSSETLPQPPRLPISVSTTTPVLSLKRKRPLKIEIPPVLSEMKKVDIKHRDQIFQEKSVEFRGQGVGVFSKKGKKKLMEDTHTIVSRLNGNPNKGFFGVYDGHGGRKAAEFVAEKLHGNIMAMSEKREANIGKEEAVKDAYLKTDAEFIKQGLSSGTCCVTCLIEEKDIVVSNVGDCRAVLCRGGLAEALTIDHRAENENERKRIENKGGYVEFHRGAWRVHGILSVSRSIGDLHLKDWVLAEPDTKIMTLTPDMDFIVLASDGLWEKVSNQEVVDTILRVRSGDEPRCTIYPWNDQENEFGYENTGPPTKSRRISLVQKMKTQPPIDVSLGLDKTGVTTDTWKEDVNAFGCENTCPVSNDFGCENTGLATKSRRISGVEKTGFKSEKDFGCENRSPPSKSRRFSSLQRMKTTSPMHVFLGLDKTRLATDAWKEDENDFGCENASPPSKAQRSSLVNQQKPTTEFPVKETGDYKKRPAPSGWLMDACKELVNLSVSKGSLDDITVMIIDLGKFQ